MWKGICGPIVVVDTACSGVLSSSYNTTTKPLCVVLLGLSAHQHGDRHAKYPPPFVSSCSMLRSADRPTAPLDQAS